MSLMIPVKSFYWVCFRKHEICARTPLTATTFVTIHHRAFEHLVSSVSYKHNTKAQTDRLQNQQQTTMATLTSEEVLDGVKRVLPFLMHSRSPHGQAEFKVMDVETTSESTLQATLHCEVTLPWSDTVGYDFVSTVQHIALAWQHANARVCTHLYNEEELFYGVPPHETALDLLRAGHWIELDFESPHHADPSSTWCMYILFDRRGHDFHFSLDVNLLRDQTANMMHLFLAQLLRTMFDREDESLIPLPSILDAEIVVASPQPLPPKPLRRSARLMQSS